MLTAAQDALTAVDRYSAAEARGIIQLVLEPAETAILEMIDKEERILLPMCMDTLSDEEWLAIAEQSPDIGFCLFAPQVKWRPLGISEIEESQSAGRIRLPSGSLDVAELNAILQTIPFDLTFVDRDDTVRYFTEGRERIFSRSRAIIGRKVQYCHPPASVNVVQRILDDFHAGRHDRAAFWITLRGRFISIEYVALRDRSGIYLGCLEVSQDLTEKRALTGEQRLLSYTDEKADHD